jgi:hypothetical protein
MRYGFRMLAAATFLCAGAGIAQEGHPLTGSWHGDWGAPGGTRARVVMFMKWDAKNVTGTINPGPRAIPMSVATLDATAWTVHIEGDGKDASGKPVHVVADGKLDNIGSYNRTVSGTWTQGGVKGDFKVTRD